MCLLNLSAIVNLGLHFFVDIQNESIGQADFAVRPSAAVKS